MKVNIFSKKHYILIQDLKQSKIHPFFPFALIIGFLLFFLASKLSAIPMLAFTSLILLVGGLDFTIIYSFQKLIIPFGTLLILIFLWIKFVERRKFSTLGFSKTDALHKFLNGFLVGFLIISVISTLILLFRGASFEFDSLFTFKSFFGFFFILIGFIVQGFAEETLSRGWLLPIISERHSVQLGILISSLFFVSLHIFNTNISALALINLFLFSIFASLYTLNNDSLWEMSALHGAWNFTQASIFGFSLNGSKVIGGSLLNMKSAGSNIVSGGEYGTNASIILTLALIVSIAFVYIKSTKEYTIKHKKKMD
ncbi:MAG: type II CAAX endopeptidase family protein [Acidaminobacteraceae bacterium]